VYDGDGASTVGEGGVWNGLLTGGFRILSCYGGLKGNVPPLVILVGGVGCVCVKLLRGGRGDIQYTEQI